MKTCLERYGFGYVWLNQGVQSVVNIFVNRVRDISLQEWNMNLNDDSQLYSYKLF